jgi:hypothetical protein
MVVSYGFDFTSQLTLATAEAQTRRDAMVTWQFGRYVGFNWALGESSGSGTHDLSLFEGEVMGFRAEAASFAEWEPTLR